MLVPKRVPGGGGERARSAHRKTKVLFQNPRFPEDKYMTQPLAEGAKLTLPPDMYFSGTITLMMGWIALNFCVAVMLEIILCLPRA